MDYSELLLFSLKTGLVVVALLVVILTPLLVTQNSSLKNKKKKKLNVQHLNKKMKQEIVQLKKHTLDKKTFKSFLKTFKKKMKKPAFQKVMFWNSMETKWLLKWKT